MKAANGAWKARPFARGVRFKAAWFRREPVPRVVLRPTVRHGSTAVKHPEQDLVLSGWRFTGSVRVNPQRVNGKPNLTDGLGPPNLVRRPERHPRTESPRATFNPPRWKE